MSLQLDSVKNRQKSWKSYVLTIIAILMILGGVYLLALISTPLILSQNINPKDNQTTQLITKTENKITENRHKFAL